MRPDGLLELISDWVRNLMWFETLQDKVLCAMCRLGVRIKLDSVSQSILLLFVCIRADLPTGAQREAQGPFLKWVIG